MHPRYQSQGNDSVPREASDDLRLSGDCEIHQNGQGRCNELRNLSGSGRRLDRHGTLPSCGQKASLQRPGDLPDRGESRGRVWLLLHRSESVGANGVLECGGLASIFANSGI